MASNMHIGTAIKACPFSMLYRGYNFLNMEFEEMEMKAIWMMAAAYIITGSAYAVSIQENINTAPISEPVIMLFIGAGLIALSAFGRKKLQ